MKSYQKKKKHTLPPAVINSILLPAQKVKIISVYTLAHNFKQQKICRSNVTPSLLPPLKQISLYISLLGIQVEYDLCGTERKPRRKKMSKRKDNKNNEIKNQNRLHQRIKTYSKSFWGMIYLPNSFKGFRFLSKKSP